MKFGFKTEKMGNIRKKCLIIIIAVICIFSGLAVGYAGENREDSIIVSDYFTDPIPSKTSWLDRRIGSGNKIEFDAIVTLASKPKDKNISLNIEKLTNRGPCFGTLHEAERLYDGYVIHFEADPVQKECVDYVNHAFLIPSGWDPDTEFYLLLYDGPVRKGHITINLKKVGKKTKIPISEKEKLRKIFDELKNKMTSLHRSKKMLDFMNNPEYEKARPLYEACMSYKINREGDNSYLKSSYCQCITEKFAFGGKLPDEEIAVYTKNFGELLKTTESKPDVFYPSTVNTCLDCGYTLDNRDLASYCVGPGPELNTAFSYYYRQKEKNKDTPIFTMPSADDYKLIVDALLNEKYNTIKKDLVYKHFYIEFIAAYSTWCEKCIGDGVDRTKYEWKEDEAGFQVGPKWETRIVIETPYIKTYDRYANDVRWDVFNAILSGNAFKLLSNINELNKFGKMATKSFVECRLYLNDFLNSDKGCMSDSVQKVYKGLLILEKNSDK